MIIEITATIRGGTQEEVVHDINDIQDLVHKEEGVWEITEQHCHPEIHNVTMEKTGRWKGFVKIRDTFHRG